MRNRKGSEAGLIDWVRTRHIPITLRVLLSSLSTPHLLCGALAATGQAGVQLMIPFVLGSIVDDALTRHDAQALWHRSLLLVALSLASFIAHVGQLLSFRYLDELGLAALQARLVTHIHSLPKRVLDELRLSEIHALFTEDGSRLAALPSEMLARGFFVLVQVVGLVILLGWKYGRQAYLLCLLVPLYAIAPVLLAPKVRAAARTLRDVSAGATARIQDLVRSTREIRIFGREAWAIRSLEPWFEDRRRGALRLELVRALTWVNYSLTYMVGAVVYWQGGLLVFQGRLTIGQLIALVALLTYLQSPVQTLVDLSSRGQALRASIDRLEPVLSTAAEDAGGDRRLSGGKAVSVEFRNVGFTYPTASVAALADLSFRVPAGSRVGLVGPSGAGKSTLVALLLRLYDVGSGSILLDGRDVHEYDLTSLRGAIGFVPQDPLLLPGTLRDNVEFGRPGATDDDFRLSCRIAGVHEFAEHLPRGYQTEIGDRGLKLSGGQRQRIALARMLLRDPALIILDEATSALEIGLQGMLLRNLKRYRPVTTFTISHRIQSVSEYSLILVLEQGRLIATGNHLELMGSCPLYRRLNEKSNGTRDEARDGRIMTEDASTPRRLHETDGKNQGSNPR